MVTYIMLFVALPSNNKILCYMCSHSHREIYMPPSATTTNTPDAKYQFFMLLLVFYSCSPSFYVAAIFIHEKKFLLFMLFSVLLNDIYFVCSYAFIFLQTYTILNPLFPLLLIILLYYSLIFFLCRTLKQSSLSPLMLPHPPHRFLCLCVD